MKKIIIILFLLVQVAISDTYNIQIYASIKYQEIDNFGASDCWSFQKIGAWPESQKDKVADLLFSTETGIGLSAWRFNIGAGINHNRINHSWRTVETFETGKEQYDWTRQVEERWFLQAAKDRGVDQFIAFVNSPPARMTRNGYTNCTDGLGTTNLKDGFESQFAQYLADIMEYFRDEWDIEFDQISPINEPQWEWNGGSQEGNRASNSDIINITEHLYSKLQQKGLNTEISLVESGNLQGWHQEFDHLENEYGENYGNYLSNVINNQRVKEKISKHIAGHSYWSDLVDGELVEHRQELFLKMFPYLAQGWKYWMTEYCQMEGPYNEGGNGRDLSINTALNVARVIHYDLTILRASAWQWWTAVSPEDYKDGLLYTNYKNNPNDLSITQSKLLWALGNYSRFIRPGYNRIEYYGENNKEGLMGSAYISPEKDKVVVVFVNTAYSRHKVNLEFAGLGEGKSVPRFTPYITSSKSDNNLKEYSSVSSDIEYEIPSRSIVTLVGDVKDSNAIDDETQNIEKFHLYQNYPNPFNNGTKISYLLKEDSNIELSIHSVLGEKITTLVDDKQYAGQYNINWNGKNNNNESVGSGIYFYSLQSSDQIIMKKMLFIQ
ncbi:T9SS type A sorting domain-containing protein [Methanococcoides sp. SA1]|nr:T9SS type A sorting domain-containing protein [Methanococcoides sp. SA1]